MRYVILFLLIQVSVVRAAYSQGNRALDQGVRVGITYAPGTLPGLLMLDGERGSFVDSVRAILQRDLDYSDLFEMIVLVRGDYLTSGPGQRSGPPASDSLPAVVNYRLYAALGAQFAVQVVSHGDSGVSVTLYDVLGETVRTELHMPNLEVGDAKFRTTVHGVADQVVLGAAGTPGIASSQVLFVRDGRLYRVDSDGANIMEVATQGRVYSPVWHPDGLSFAYVNFPGNSRIRVVSIAGGFGDPDIVVAPADGVQDFAPSFSPNGAMMVFARASRTGTDIYSYDLADNCCLQRLTVGRFSDNLSPTYSPDGRQIAFVSTRAGQPQIYVMASEGTGQELFAPFDFGVTGSSFAPEWSPDGLNIAFHRDVEGSTQVFVMDVASRSVRQLTSAGRNEDPTWAPDGRHLAYVSSRAGSNQIWIIDSETGRIRQLTRMGKVRLPAWSSRQSGSVLEKTK